MTKPLEFAYFQLIDGKMYPAKKEKGKLKRSTTFIPDAALEPKIIDTVIPKFSVIEDED